MDITEPEIDPSRPADWRIKSFVRRAARMTDGQKKALEDLYPRFGVDAGVPVDLKALFPGFTRFVLEIGFGMGDATLELAATLPETAFVAVDVYTPGIGRVLAEIEKRGLKNLRVVNSDVVELLPKLPQGSWEGIHVFFPDPWPKKKHHKRRLLKTDFVRTLVPLLKKDGYLYAATDWEEYAQEILEAFGQVEDLRNDFPDWAEVPWRPKTKFENRGLQEGRPIREIFFRRKA